MKDRIIRELGGIHGPYTGRCFNRQRKTGIKHIVARFKVHDSGL